MQVCFQLKWLCFGSWISDWRTLQHIKCEFVRHIWMTDVYLFVKEVWLGIWFLYVHIWNIVCQGDVADLNDCLAFVRNCVLYLKNYVKSYILCHMLAYMKVEEGEISNGIPWVQDKGRRKFQAIRLIWKVQRLDAWWRDCRIKR